MANEVKIEAYYLEIRDLIKSKKNSTNSMRAKYPLDNIRGVDFQNVLLDFLSSFTFDRDIQLQKSFSIMSCDKSMTKHRIVSGVYESGEFGYSSKVRNAKGKAILNKKKEASVDIPFFFMFYVPKGKTKGILLFQRLGRNGGYTVFKKKLTEYCNKHIPNKVLEFSAILSKEVAKQMINHGTFKELILRKHFIPRDKIELLDGGSNDQTLSKQVNFHLSIKAAERGKSLGLKRSLNKFLKDGKLITFSIPQLEDYMGKSFKVSTKIRYDGADRVLDLSENMQIKPMFDVSEEVLRNEGGHPRYEDILKVSKSILDDLKKLK